MHAVLNAIYIYIIIYELTLATVYIIQYSECQHHNNCEAYMV